MSDAQLEILLMAKDRAGQAFNSVSNRIKALTDTVFSLNGALVGIGAVTSFGYVAKRAIDATAEIERNAQMAGVAVEAYQELAFASEHYGVTQEAVTDALKELNLRADEFVATAGGSAAEAFQRLGYGQAELNVRLRDAPALLEDIIRRMEGLDRAAQIRIADEIFGGQGGEQFVRMIRAGADELNNLRRRAHDLGLVIDKDLVDQSVEAQRRIDELAKVLQVNLQKTLVSLSPTIVKVSEGILKWVEENNKLLEQDMAGWVEAFSSAVGELGDSILEVAVGKVRSDWEDFWDWTENRIKKLKNPIDTLKQDLEDFHKIASGNATVYTPRPVSPGEISAHEERRLARYQPTGSDGGAYGGGGGRRTAYTDAQLAEFAKGADAYVDYWRVKLAERDEVVSRSYDVMIEAEEAANERMIEAQEAANERSKLLADARVGDYVDSWQIQARDAADVHSRGLQAIIDAEKNANKKMVDLTQHTAELMQENFSGFFYDAMRGEMDSFGDYVERLFDSILKSWSDLMAKMLAESVFTEKSSSLWSGVSDFVTGLFSNSGGNPSESFYYDWYTSNAKGNAFGPEGLKRFASGGIVTRPTFFGYSGGRGIMGESGPEAIMPLQRMSNGRLGVASDGSAGATIALSMPITIQAIDSKSGMQWLKDNSGGVAEAVIDEMKHSPALSRFLRNN